jgi:hypothetical protein
LNKQTHTKKSDEKVGDGVQVTCVQMVWDNALKQQVLLTGAADGTVKVGKLPCPLGGSTCFVGELTSITVGGAPK